MIVMMGTKVKMTLTHSILSPIFHSCCGEETEKTSQLYCIDMNVLPTQQLCNQTTPGLHLEIVPRGGGGGETGDFE